MSKRIYNIAFKLNAMLGSKYAKTFEQAESNAEKLATTFDAVGKRMTLAVTLPIKAVGVASVMAAKNWESSWVGVRKVTKGSEEDLAALEKTARNMARELPHTHDAIASVFEAGSRLGVATEHLEGFSRTMLAVEATTTLSLDNAANGFATISSIMGTSQADFDRMGSTIGYLGSNFSAVEDEILGMSTQMAGAAAQAGVTEAQLMGFSTAIASLGMSSAAGATTFSNFIGDMNRAVALGGARLQEFADVAGIASNEFAKVFEEDASSAVLAFVSGLKSIEDEGGNVLLTLNDLGLTGSYMEQMLTGLVSGYDTLESALDSANMAWEENVFLTNAVKERYSTLEAQVQVMKGRLRDTGITIGEVLMPYVSDLVTGISNLVDGFSNLNDGTQKVIIVTGMFVASIGPVLTIGGKVIKTVLAAKLMFDKWFLSSINLTGSIHANTASVTKNNLVTSKFQKVVVITVGLWGKYTASVNMNSLSLGKNIATQKAFIATATGKVKALGLLKLGFMKLNAIMLANPIGMAIAGVVALTAGIVGLAKWVNRISAEYSALGEEAQQFLEVQLASSEASVNSAKQFEANIQNLQSSQSVTRDYAKSIEDLTSKQELSAGEMARLEYYIDHLNNSVPSLALAYDKQTGSLNMTTEAMQKYLSVAERESILDAALLERTRILEEAVSLEVELLTVSQRRNELEEQLNNGDRIRRKDRRALEEVIQDLIVAEEGYRETLEINSKNYENVNKLINENAEYLQNMRMAQEDAAISMHGLDEAMRRQAFNTEEWQQAQSDAISKMTSSFENYKSIAVNAFDTVNQNATISFDKMIENMNANAAAVEKWSINLAILAEQGLEEGLIKQLEEAGPSAAAQVEQLVAELERVPERVNQLNDAYEGSTSVAMDAMKRGFDPKGVAQSAEELIEIVALSILEDTQMEEAVIDKVNKSFDVFNETIENVSFDSAGYDIAAGVAIGLLNGSGMVYDAGVTMIKNTLAGMKEAAQIKSPSRKTMEMGEFLMEGLSVGMYSKENEIISACKDITDGITDNLSVDMPSIKIPKWVPGIGGKSIGYKGAISSKISNTNFENQMESKGITRSLSTFTEFNKFENLTHEDNVDISYSSRPIDTIKRMEDAKNSYADDSIVVKYNPQFSINGSGHSVDELKKMVEQLLQESYTDLEHAIEQVIEKKESRRMRLSNV